MCAPVRTLHYDDPSVTLEGQAYTDFFFGRPNYGGSPDTDEIEHPIILALDEPIRVDGNGEVYEGNYEGTTEEDVDRVQIATRDVGALRELRGHGLRITGSLWHAHTGHHHTNVLIGLDDVTAIDARNTYPDRRLIASGSGCLLGHDGLIATAAHILDDCTDVSVTRGLYRQRASIIALDRDLDLAVLKIEPAGPLADVVRQREGKVRPTRTWMPPRLGERVYALGFPLRSTLPHSLNVTEGLISSELGIRGHEFQISAAIQPGNSGGPVFDEFGNLIGLAVSSLEPSQTLNFCIRASEIAHFCYGYGIELSSGEQRETKLPTSILAGEALHFCVEVEGWTDKPDDDQ